MASFGDSEPRPYEPIVGVAELAGMALDAEAWERKSASLERLVAAAGANAYTAALAVVARTAATETGAIENLYETSPGMTITVAEQRSGWQDAVKEFAPNSKSHIDAQLRTYETILAEAKDQEFVLTEAWVRELHKIVTEGQEFYEVITAVGPQRRRLLKGQYKDEPNQVIDRYGRTIMYAPPEATPADMARLFENIRSHEFNSAHPVVQAAYVHYGITHIHPFADGNGRIARALASLYLFRSADVPLLIFADRKAPYFQALEVADNRQIAPFVSYVQERALDAMSWMCELLRMRSRPSITATSAHLETLMQSQDGPPIESFDQAAVRVFTALRDQLRAGMPPILGQLSAVQVEISNSPELFFNHDSGFRELDISRLNYHDPGTLAGFRIDCVIQEPINVEVDSSIRLFVASRAGGRAAVRIGSASAVPDLSLRADDIIPSLSAGAEVRIETYAIAIWADLMTRLVKDAHQVLREHGRLPVELHDLPW